jgi:integrase
MSNETDHIALDEGLAIYKLKQSKNWYIYLWDKETKKPIRKSLGISDRKKAEHKAIFYKMAKEENLEGSILSQPTQKLKTIINGLLKSYEDERKDLNTRDNKYKELGRYINIFDELKEGFGEVSIKDLDYAHLLAFYQKYENKISKTQLRYMNLAIKKLFNHCLSERLISVVPAIPKIKTKVGETGTYFTNTDYNTIVNKLRSRNRKKGIPTENNKLLLNAFIYTTQSGIRTGQEITNIQCSDLTVEEIQGNKYWICQIKGGKIAEKDGVKRKIILTPMAMNCIKDILSDTAFTGGFGGGIVDAHLIRILKDNKDRYLFRRKSGKEVDFSILFSELKKEISDDLIEKNLKMYSCRHTFITNQLKRGANINIVAKHCGTSVEMISKHYNHLLSIMKPTELLEEGYNVETKYQVVPEPDIGFFDVLALEKENEKLSKMSHSEQKQYLKDNNIPTSQEPI